VGKKVKIAVQNKNAAPLFPRETTAPVTPPVAVDAQDANASELVLQTTSALDKVASKGAIPAKRAARLKSRLMQRLHKSA